MDHPKRNSTRPIKIRTITIGGGHPVTIQSMTNTRTTDIEATLGQIAALQSAGAQIVRVSVPDRPSAEAFRRIRAETSIPLVADIHFSAQLAVAAIEAGADKIRINPGNIGGSDKVRRVVDAAKVAHIPIRIGVNSGSLEKEILERHGGPTPQALLESCLGHIRMLESWGFENIVLSIKASDVVTTVEACRLLAVHSDYPQHIGITESGTVRTGTIRSAVGIGALLSMGIGDTIRVSLAGDPVHEIGVAREILKSLNLATGPVVIACPTCSRTRIDVAALAERVETLVAELEYPVKIAVMGCIVNGPGEAREADIGIAGGDGEGWIFIKGERVAKVAENDLLDELRARLLQRRRTENADPE